MQKVISTDKAPSAIGPYSQAIEVNGMVYTSGVIPVDPPTGQIVEGGVEAQANQAFKNLINLVEASGLVITVNDRVEINGLEVHTIRPQRRS